MKHIIKNNPVSKFDLVVEWSIDFNLNKLVTLYANGIPVLNILNDGSVKFVRIEDRGLPLPTMDGYILNI